MRLSSKEATVHIKDQLKDYLASEFGITNLSKNFRCLNPDHEDKNPSMSYDKKHNRVKCFSGSCGVSYDTLELVGIANNIPKDDYAAKFQKAREIFDIQIDINNNHDGPKAREYPLEMKKVDPEIEAYISECHKRVNETNYFKERGLSEEIINKYTLGYDPNYCTSATRFQPWQVAIIPTGNTYNARNTALNSHKDDRYRKPTGKDTEFFNLSALDERQVVFITEGELDTLSIITAGAQAVGLGSGAYARKFVDYLETHKPNAYLVIVPDNDEPGETTKNTLAEGFERLNIPYSVDNLSGEFKDPNEALVKDRDSFIEAVQYSLRDHQIEMEQTEEPQKEETEALISIDDLIYQEADFLVDRILEKDSLVAVFGESGAGKSFFVLDLLLSVAAGIDFHGRGVKKTPCIYICAEGQRGLVKRNKAWNIKRWGKPDGKKQFFPVTSSITLPDDLMEQKLIDLIDSTIKQYNISDPGIIAFDTLARTLAGDENSNSDVSKYIQALDRIKARYQGATVILVHHVGHGEKDRARGASALKCALDCEIKVEIKEAVSGNKIMSVSNKKMKDAEEFPDLYFEMKSVEVYQKEDGEPETSLFLEEVQADAVVDNKGKAKRLSAVDQVGIDSFLKAFYDKVLLKVKEGNTDGAGEGITLEEWREYYNKHSTADNPNTKTTYFGRARKSLVNDKKMLEVENDIYKLAGDEHQNRLNCYLITCKEELSRQSDTTRLTSESS